MTVALEMTLGSAMTDRFGYAKANRGLRSSFEHLSVPHDVRRFRIGRFRNAAIVDRTDCGALRFVKMAGTLGTAIMRNDIYIVSHSLAVAHMIPLSFRVAASFEDGLVRTFRQTGSTVDTFGGYQQ